MTLLTFGEFTDKQPEYDITYEQYCAHMDGELIESLSLRRILDKLIQNFKEMADDLKMAWEHLKDIFKQRDIFSVLKTFGFSLKRMAAATLKAVKSLNVILLDVFEQMHENGDFNLLVNGSKGLDGFMDKYPLLKKVTGPMVAGFLVYQWQNMSFSGDFENDFNVSNIADAMRGKYTIEDVFASPGGLKALTQLGTGLMLGITFPWGRVVPATLYLAFLYTGSKKIRDPQVQTRLRTTMTKYRPKVKRIPKYRPKKS